MPRLFFAASDDNLRARAHHQDQHLGTKHNVWGRTWTKVGGWLKREEERRHGHGKTFDSNTKQNQDEAPQPPLQPAAEGRRFSRTVVPELPRLGTFKRQESEQRDHLYEHEPNAAERRAKSIERRASRMRLGRLSLPPMPRPAFSAPDMRSPDRPEFNDSPTTPIVQDAHIDAVFCEDVVPVVSEAVVEEDVYVPDEPELAADQELHSDDGLDGAIQAELEAKWILNLSMHYRDNSDREKFFITFAQELNKWRRVTVSIDYRNLEPDSLEHELKLQLQYQRDKSARIFACIRDSLPDIQFYPTVTNLKLQTADGRLHVHVTEDKPEIIHYPSVSKVRHIGDSIKRYRESEVEFDSHLSGFVYMVRCPDGQFLVKKEIPGPEAVDEFLYEIDALYNLVDSPNVIRLEALVISDDGTLVKGLLIRHAQQGALVDLLYDFKYSDYLPWSRRARWAKQVVQGLSDLHEAGFTQGDFTLSNIVIDDQDNAKIIDINRRGCPVGWEPPELLPNIRAGQRISMRIGPKTDLFQLGMVLWALGEQDDEPERRQRSLTFSNPADVPQWYQDIVYNCLQKKPKDRLHAKELLQLFPDDVIPEVGQHAAPIMSLAPDRLDTDYIDPAAAVSREDIDHSKREQERELQSAMSRRSNIDSEATFADVAASTEYVLESSGSYIVGRRDASPNSSRPSGSHSHTIRQQNEDGAEECSPCDDKISHLLPPPIELLSRHRPALLELPPEAENPQGLTNEFLVNVEPPTPLPIPDAALPEVQIA